MLLPLHLNLQGAPAPAPAPSPAPANDGGAGRKHWPQDNVVDPWELYGFTEEEVKPEEKIEKLQQKIEKLEEVKAPALPDITALKESIQSLKSASSALENRFEEAIKQREINEEINEGLRLILDDYRALYEEIARQELLAAEMSERIALHAQAIVRDDEAFIEWIADKVAKDEI